MAKCLIKCPIVYFFSGTSTIKIVCVIYIIKHIITKLHVTCKQGPLTVVMGITVYCCL